MGNAPSGAFSFYNGTKYKKSVKLSAFDRQKERFASKRKTRLYDRKGGVAVSRGRDNGGSKKQTVIRGGRNDMFAFNGRYI